MAKAKSNTTEVALGAAMDAIHAMTDEPRMAFAAGLFRAQYDESVIIIGPGYVRTVDVFVATVNKVNHSFKATEYHVDELMSTLDYGHQRRTNDYCNAQVQIKDANGKPLDPRSPTAEEKTVRVRERFKAYREGTTGQRGVTVDPINAKVAELVARSSLKFDKVASPGTTVIGKAAKKFGTEATQRARLLEIADGDKVKAGKMYNKALATARAVIESMNIDLDL